MNLYNEIIKLEEQKIDLERQLKSMWSRSNSSKNLMQQWQNERMTGADTMNAQSSRWKPEI